VTSLIFSSWCDCAYSRISRELDHFISDRETPIFYFSIRNKDFIYSIIEYGVHIFGTNQVIIFI